MPGAVAVAAATAAGLECSREAVGFASAQLAAVPVAVAVPEFVAAAVVARKPPAVVAVVQQAPLLPAAAPAATSAALWLSIALEAVSIGAL